MKRTKIWKDYIREGKSDLIMRYVDEIRLKQKNNLIYVDEILFRESICKPCNELFDKGYIDVKTLYLEEFEEARLEYNKEQENKGRNDRKITDYFKKISDNSKNDLACEIIIELEDKKYWDTKDDKFKYKITNVFKEQLNDL
jgi:hypothetical protein